MLKKTFRGQMIDMDVLSRQNEETVAAGNMGVNARGDKLGPGGEVIQTVQERSRRHHKNTKKKVSRVGLKELEDKAEDNKTEVFPEEKQKPKKSKKIEVEDERGDITLKEAPDEDQSS